MTVKVTLTIDLDDSQVAEFEKMIPVQLALPPWNYVGALEKGIMVRDVHTRNDVNLP